MISRFKKVIKLTGLSHIEFADKLGVKSHDISNMSAGRKQITPEFALQLEKEFNINPCWLFFDRGNMFNDIGFDLEGTEKETLTLEEVYKKVEKLTSIVSDIQESYGKK